MNRIEQIEARLAEIRGLVQAGGEIDVAALNTEVDALQEERKSIDAAIEQRKALVERVSNGDFPVLHGFAPVEGGTEERSFDANSPEYRSAYWKTMVGQELNATEKRAFTHTTALDVAMPKQSVDAIWNLMEERHPIVADITMYRTGTVIEITKHTAIVAGDAAGVEEGVANTDEQNTFATVTLSGKDFAKSVEVSFALDKMAGPEFERYITQEIADRLGAALAADIVAQIGTDMDAGNKALATAAGAFAFSDITKVFAALKNINGVTVYVNQADLYNHLVALENTAGNLIFQPSIAEGAQGVVLGAQVKIEDAVPAGAIYFGDPKRVVGNMVQDIDIRKSADPKRPVNIYSGYARFQCALGAPKAFAKLTITPAV